MFDGDYSKKVWIISIVMATGLIILDLYIFFGEDSIMKDSIWMTLPLTVYVLFKSIQGLKRKIEEEKNGK